MMARRILLATQKPFAASAVKGIEDIAAKAGMEVVKLEKYESEGELRAAVADVDAMIVRSDKVTPEVLDAAEKLKIIVRAGAGYDNLDLEACTRHGVVAMNTPGQNSNAVAELAVGLMIYMSRNLFTPSTGCELSGKTIGIQAYGNVGRLVGRKASALGMKVMAVDPFLSKDEILAGGAIPVDTVEELYSRCDFISIHVPATAQTVGAIGYDLLSRAPKGAIIVNTARKEVIDEAGLLRILKEREDLKYVTDIAPDNYEALKAACGLRVFATPGKMGAQTAQANVNAALAAARQIVDFFLGGDRKYQLNVW